MWGAASTATSLLPPCPLPRGTASGSALPHLWLSGAHLADLPSRGDSSWHQECLSVFVKQTSPSFPVPLSQYLGDFSMIHHIHSKIHPHFPMLTSRDIPHAVKSMAMTTCGSQAKGDELQLRLQRAQPKTCTLNSCGLHHLPQSGDLFRFQLPL